MLTLEQNATVYLMFLNGLLFLGLNFIARSILHPDLRRSKRMGYVFILTAILVFIVQEEYSILLTLHFPPEKAREILLAGFCVPVFIISLLYYRIQRSVSEKKSINKIMRQKDDNEDH